MKNHILVSLFFTLLSCEKKDEKKCDLIGDTHYRVYYCKSNELHSDTPAISNILLSPKQISQGFHEGSYIEFKISFTDGDGDLGSHAHWFCYTGDDCYQHTCIDTASIALITFSDTRGNCVGFSQLPFGENLNAPITGDIYYQANYICCIDSVGNYCTPSIQHPKDTLTYKIKIRDNAGHWSNEVETPPLIVLCN